MEFENQPQPRSPIVYASPIRRNTVGARPATAVARTAQHQSWLNQDPFGEGSRRHSRQTSWSSTAPSARSRKSSASIGTLKRSFTFGAKSRPSIGAPTDFRRLTEPLTEPIPARRRSFRPLELSIYVEPDGRLSPLPDFSADEWEKHTRSSTRTARMMAGMRYERGGKGKYWIPKVEHHHKTPLLGSSKARTMSPGVSSSRSRERGYGTNDESSEDPMLDAEEEKLYDSARALEFGDWNVRMLRKFNQMCLLIIAQVSGHYCAHGKSRGGSVSKSSHCHGLQQSSCNATNQTKQEAEKEQDTEHTRRGARTTTGRRFKQAQLIKRQRQRR